MTAKQDVPRAQRIFNAFYDTSPYPQSFDPNYKPPFHRLSQMYQPYLADKKPCKGGVENQCAVRLSIALQRSGLTLSSFQPRERIHQGEAHGYEASCGMDREHVTGAQELADYLRTIWGAPRVFGRDEAKDARAKLLGLTGVVFFKDCFTRAGQTGKVGDHIDMFEGGRYFNERIALSAGGNASAGADLFGLATQVWFFHMPM